MMTTTTTTIIIIIMTAMMMFAGLTSRMQPRHEANKPCDTYLSVH